MDDWSKGMESLFFVDRDRELLNATGFNGVND
jgi:hypothetical protein